MLILGVPESGKSTLSREIFDLNPRDYALVIDDIPVGFFFDETFIAGPNYVKGAGRLPYRDREQNGKLIRADVNQRPEFVTVDKVVLLDVSPDYTSQTVEKIEGTDALMASIRQNSPWGGHVSETFIKQLAASIDEAYLVRLPAKERDYAAAARDLIASSSPVGQPGNRKHFIERLKGGVNFGPELTEETRPVRAFEIEMLGRIGPSAINPDGSRDITVYYPGAGFDVLGPLAATDASRYVFVDLSRQFMGDTNGLDNFTAIEKQLRGVGAVDLNMDLSDASRAVFTFGLPATDGRIKNREIIYYVNKDAASFVPPEVTSDSLDGASGYDVLYVSYSPFLGGDLFKKVVSNLRPGGHVVMNSGGRGETRHFDSVSEMEESGLKVVANVPISRGPNWGAVVIGRREPQSAASPVKLTPEEKEGARELLGSLREKGVVKGARVKHTAQGLGTIHSFRFMPRGYGINTFVVHVKFDDGSFGSFNARGWAEGSLVTIKLSSSPVMGQSIQAAPPELVQGPSSSSPVEPARDMKITISPKIKDVLNPQASSSPVKARSPVDKSAISGVVKTFESLQQRFTRTGGVKSYSKLQEDLISRVKKGKEAVSISMIKLQDLKWLNTLGEELGVGHEIGDKVLAYTGPEINGAIREAIRETVKSYNQTVKEGEAPLNEEDIDFDIYKAGPNYAVVFEGAPQVMVPRQAQVAGYRERNARAERGVSFTEDVLSNVLLRTDAVTDNFRNKIVNRIKTEIAEEHPELKEKVDAFGAGDLNFYAGISPVYTGGAEVNLTEAKQIADNLYSEALQAGKYVQLSEFSNKLPQTRQAIVEEALKGRTLREQIRQ